MSAKATNWVWEESASTGSARLVLLALADYANEKGVCFASYRGLAKKTRLGLATVTRALRELEEAGEVKQLEPGEFGTASSHKAASDWLLPKIACAQSEHVLNLSTSCAQSEHTTILNNTINKRSASPRLQQSATDNTISHHKLKQNKSPNPPSVFNPEGIPLPHGPRLAHVWGEFCQHRRELKRKLTPISARLILKDLASVSEDVAVDCLSRSIKNGWQGVFLPEAPSQRPTTGKIVSLPSQNNSAFMQELKAIREAVGE